MAGNLDLHFLVAAWLRGADAQDLAAGQDERTASAVCRLLEAACPTREGARPRSEPAHSLGPSCWGSCPRSVFSRVCGSLPTVVHSPIPLVAGPRVLGLLPRLRHHGPARPIGLAQGGRMPPRGPGQGAAGGLARRGATGLWRPKRESGRCLPRHWRQRSQPSRVTNGGAPFPRRPIP